MQTSRCYNFFFRSEKYFKSLRNCRENSVLVFESFEKSFLFCFAFTQEDF